MNISVIIAQILGIFFMVVGVSMVLNRKFVADALEEAIRNRGYLWTWGFLAVATGAVIVPFSNSWTLGLPLVITIIGWLALIKGAFIFIFPDTVIALYSRFNKGGVLVVVGFVVFVLGLALLYIGLM